MCAHERAAQTGWAFAKGCPEFVSSRVATSRGEEICVEGLDGLKHKLIYRPPETETQIQLGTVLTESDPRCTTESKSHRFLSEVSS